MNEKQALEVLKEIVNVAVKRGLFENIESTSAASLALQVITEKINKDEQSQ